MTTTKIVKQEVVGPYKQIQTAVQDYTIIDGVETPISGLRRLRVIAPGDDTSDMPTEVQQLAASLHTSELISQYQANDPNAEPTLEQVKADKIKAIALQRYQIEIGGVTYTENETDYIIRSDRDDVSRLKETTDEIIARNIASIDWKCKNDLWLEINTSNVAAIKTAMLTHIQSCFAAEKAAQEEINAMTTVEAVNSYKLSIG